MAITLGTLVERLQRTSPAITLAARRELNEPLPVVRARVKASAGSKLPQRGGLAAWGAAAHVTAQLTTRGDRVTAHLKVHRTSMFRPSDLRALDRGRVRHPAWGRRWSGQWFIQMVTPKVYSEPIQESPEWHRAVVRAAEHGGRVITRG